MIATRLTVGTSAVQVSVLSTPSLGMKLLARLANSGAVFVGTSSDVTTSTGVKLPRGEWESSFHFVVPHEHFSSNGQVWLVADAAGQLVDVNYE